MSDPIGGHLFIPTSADFTSLEVLLHALELLGEPASHSTLFPPTVAWIDQPLAESMQTLRRADPATLPDYRVGLSIAGYWSYLQVEELPGYHVLLVTSDQSQFRWPDPWHDPALVEEFSDRWLATCEALRVLYGYYSHGISMPTTEHRQTVLKRLAAGEIDELVTNAHWRSYLGSPLMARWGEEMLALADARVGAIQRAGDTYSVEQRPSGALVLAAGLGYNPCQGDFDLDQQAQFLVRQVEPHQQIPGVAALLAELQGELQGRIARIEAALGTSSVKRDEVRQSRAYLNGVRGLWACAQEHSGLVGVNQSMAVRRANGQDAAVVVPVVAGNGQEWLLPLNRAPFNSEDAAWNTPDSGIRAQVEDLLLAARQHPLHGATPRVIVVLWNGISPEIQRALVNMGAQVEQPGHRPIFHAPPEE
jgi:hypothetical protein